MFLYPLRTFLTASPWDAVVAILMLSAGGMNRIGLWESNSYPKAPYLAAVAVIIVMTVGEVGFSKPTLHRLAKDKIGLLGSNPESALSSCNSIALVHQCMENAVKRKRLGEEGGWHKRQHGWLKLSFTICLEVVKAKPSLSKMKPTGSAQVIETESKTHA